MPQDSTATVPPPQARSTLPIALGPRQPHPDDITLADIARQPQGWVDDQTLAADDPAEVSAACLRAYTEHVRLRESVGDRAIAALVGKSLSDTEWTEHEMLCPVCGCGQLILEISRRKVRGACARECSPLDIAAELASYITDTEEQAIVGAERVLANELAKKLDIQQALDETPPPEWIVPSLIADGALTMIGGTSGDGKTWLALWLGICVATGTKWLMAPVEQARTLLVLLEGSDRDRYRRIRLLAKGLGVSVASLSGKLDIYPMPLRADEPQTVTELARVIKMLGHKFVVIDNLTEIRGNTDENSSAAMGAALRPLANLAHELDIGILLIHHANSKGELRGSSAIKQHCDAVLELARTSAANNALVRISRTKDRGGQTQDRRFKLLDQWSTQGEHQAVVPTNAHPAELDDNEQPELKSNLPDVATAFATKREQERERCETILRMLPCSSENLYRRNQRTSRTIILMLRKKLEAAGKVTFHDGMWHQVKSAE